MGQNELCKTCHGTKTVTVSTHKKGQPIKQEQAPCPSCGGTGTSGLRTK